jgi:endonuclease YncB( thermonuclease family)
MKILALFVFALAAVLPIQSHSQILHGTVARHIDGDSFYLAVCGDTLDTRLHGIDTPERGQSFYNEATDKFRELAPLGAPLTVLLKDVDKYGRPVVRAYLADGCCLNEKMVSTGMAWWYKKYAPNDDTLKAFMAQARAERRGLWIEENPIPPSEWRKKKRK